MSPTDMAAKVLRTPTIAFVVAALLLATSIGFGIAAANAKTTSPSGSTTTSLIPGPSGPPGPAGSAGASGARGATGPPGAQGDQGQAGAPGTSGQQGIPGAVGGTGPRGPG